MTTRRVLVLQHAEPEHLGLIADALTEEGVQYSYIRTDLDVPVPEEIEPHQGLVVMGGYQSVYEEQQYPYLRGEKTLIRKVIRSGRPVLGICLGSQLLAEALGSQVRSSGSFELGWKKVYISSDVSNDPVLKHLPRIIEPMHWHGDIYGLPAEAVSVGASDQTAVQGFVWRQRCYGFLFHLETTVAQVSQMAQTFPKDVVRGGLTTDALLAQAQDRIPGLHNVAMTAFRNWARLL